MNNLGAPRIVTGLYISTFFLFVVIGIFRLVFQLLLPLIHQSASFTQGSIYEFLCGLAVTLIVGCVLYNVGRAAWGKTNQRVTASMLVSIVACLLFVPAIVLARQLPPQVCVVYQEPVGADIKHPVRKLTSQNCVAKISKPIFKRYQQNCAIYLRQTAVNTYETMEPICVKGFDPAARSD